jgi:hypothetical protein
MNLNVQKHMVNCSVCEGNASYINSVLFRNLVGISDEYEQHIYACDNCDFIFTPNYIDDDLIENYYKNISKYEGNKVGEVEVEKKLMSQRQYDFIKSSGADYTTILEIGASTGFNLSTFKSNNKKVFGVEPSGNNKITAKKLYDIDLFDGMYDDFYKKYSSNKYDLIFMSHVLEHIHNPTDFIKKITNQNKKYIYIEVPSFEIQIESEPYGSFFYEHVNHFTSNSLSYLMGLHGFTSIKMSIEFNVKGESPSYPVICSLWEKSSKPKYIKTMVRAKKTIQNHLESSRIIFNSIEEKINAIPSGAKVAVWGTGSHTSRLLGMTGLLKKNIVKFYDSDIKKQQFTINEIKISEFCIDDLKNGLVDVILVSTFSGEKSILDFIKTLDVNVDVVSLYH